MIIALAIGAGLVFATIGWILIVPVCVNIDSNRKEYRISQWGTFSVRFLFERTINVDVRIIGIKLSLTGGRDVRGKGSKQRSAKKNKSVGAWMFLVRRIVKCVTVDKCVLDLDTDNYTINALLVPGFVLASHGNTSLRINFVGRASLLLKANIQLIRVLWVFILFQTKT